MEEFKEFKELVGRGSEKPISFLRGMRILFYSTRCQHPSLPSRGQNDPWLGEQIGQIARRLSRNLIPSFCVFGDSGASPYHKAIFARRLLNGCHQFWSIVWVPRVSPEVGVFQGRDLRIAEAKDLIDL